MAARKKRGRMSLARLTAALTLGSGIALCFCSFYHPPGGSVDSSVLFYFGQTLLYAGSVFGVKLLMSEEIRRLLGPGPPDAKAGKP